MKEWEIFVNGDETGSDLTDSYVEGPYCKYGTIVTEKSAYDSLMVDAVKIVETAKGCSCSGDVLNAVDVWCEKYGDRA